VTLRRPGGPLHGATVSILELGQAATTGANGGFLFEGVPAGTYRVEAHLSSAVTEQTLTVAVAEGETATLDFVLDLTVERHEITVTASGREETAFESVQTVESLNSFDLSETAGASLGEILDSRPGSAVAKRSFGPGSSRPIIRGFDGDRVLVMQDGIRTGTLSSQSGDHGELMNTAALDRLEVVKGPATLLYGSNALGGVVNAITRHHAIHEHPHQGLNGFISGSGGSNNGHGGGAAGFEYGHGKWLIWGGGGGLRTGDYDTPIGEIFNSRSRQANGYAGLGWYGTRNLLSFGIKVDDGVYGVPFATEFEAHGGEAGEGGAESAEEHAGDERIQLEARREAYEFSWTFKGLGPAIEQFRLKLSQTLWNHDEVEIAGAERAISTQFDQNQFVYRGEFEQRQRGRLSGRFGFWGLVRDYDVAGAEALSPPVDHDAVAAFGLEELSFERVKLQFGGRLERNAYDPMGLSARSFTGASAAAGIRTELWRGGAFVANYAHSTRAPALEELYNNGPHVGSLSFEVGNPDLKKETGNGIELSLRQQGRRVRGELNLFHYGFENFVFPFATGEIEDGLQVIEFVQRDSRFTGGEASLDFALATNVWLNLGADFVDAQETQLNTPLPRIPPFRGKIGLDVHAGNFAFKPELILANEQAQTFTGETRTPGYGVVNLKASYTLARTHLIHQFSFNIFNAGDQLYRNHSSFIKNLAPEIGRGVQFSYKIRLF
jgi:iron complex outermembrane receptor protein